MVLLAYVMVALGVVSTVLNSRVSISSLSDWFNNDVFQTIHAGQKVEVEDPARGIVFWSVCLLRRRIYPLADSGDDLCRLYELFQA